jgi:hypothetical protein
MTNGIPETPENRALGFVYDTLCDLERFQMERAKKEGREGDAVTADDIQEARLFSRAIEACKFWKDPEFLMRFGDGSPYPENGWQCRECDWPNLESLDTCRNCTTAKSSDGLAKPVPENEADHSAK